MVTRQQMDEVGRKVRDLMQQGLRDDALMEWVNALDRAHLVSLFAWSDDSLDLMRQRVRHLVTWRSDYVQGEPEFVVIRFAPAEASGPEPLGVRHEFATALAAATFIVTGRDVNAPPLSYRIVVHEKGKMPEVEAEVVCGIDEALDRLVEEVALTEGAPRMGVLNVERAELLERGRLTLYGVTPDEVLYYHTIERA